MIVVMTVRDLRRSEVQISQISWERTQTVLGIGS
jgi:hypothetical protein